MSLTKYTPAQRTKSDPPEGFYVYVAPQENSRCNNCDFWDADLQQARSTCGTAPCAWYNRQEKKSVFYRKKA